VVRVKQLEEEVDRSHATTPALAEAAARSEVVQLKRELDEARAAAAVPQPRARGSRDSSAVSASATSNISRWLASCGMLVAGVGGFWLGYATLARRVRSRFGGLKVY
jgi:hypothetical protein